MAVVQISQAQGRVPVTIFRLQDRVNLGNFAELEDTAKESYDKGTRDMVMDLGQTVSLTSIGIRAIVIIHKLLSTDGGKRWNVLGDSFRRRANHVGTIRIDLQPVGLGKEREVLRDGQLVPDHRALRAVAEAAVHTYGTIVAREETHDDLHQHALAGPVLTD